MEFEWAFGVVGDSDSEKNASGNRYFKEGGEFQNKIKGCQFASKDR